MKASLVAYDCIPLYKKSNLKINKNEYVKGCPKWLVTQIWLFEILVINVCSNLSSYLFMKPLPHSYIYINVVIFYCYSIFADWALYDF
jgi:hypothetical protein